MNEKAILEKLVKIAANQQKILQRLAQQADETVTYLQRSAQVAAANSGISLTIPQDVQVTASGGGYRVVVSLPANTQPAVKDKFVMQFTNQIKAQKPDLANKVQIEANMGSQIPPAIERVGEPP